MKKIFPINFGNKIVLKQSKVVSKHVLQGGVLQFNTEWKILKRLQENAKICYYITDGISKTITFLDTEYTLKDNVPYSKYGEGDIFSDTVEISIPYDLTPGIYEINTFIFPSEGFESSKGIPSAVWPSQRVIGNFEAVWQDDLYKKLQKHKNTRNKIFFNSLIEYWSKNPNWYKSPNIYMWADFAFSTNARGTEIMNILEKYSKIQGKSFLDVGCAYCGFLVAAQIAGAKTTEGIDINGELIDLGKANLKDFNMEAVISVDSILDEKYISKKKNKFDVITCNDVIEHVLDPELAIKNISNLLSSDGVAMFVIPNMNNPNFVLQDGHFSAFAITLLDREEAINYYDDLCGGDYSSVGFYHTLDTYKKLFEKYGLQFVVDNSTLMEIDIKKVREGISFLKENREKLISKVSLKYRGLIEERLTEYLENFDKNARDMSNEDLLLYYGPEFWTIIGKK